MECEDEQLDYKGSCHHCFCTR